MINEEINNLVKKYFKKEGYNFPSGFEHRLDPNSSAIMYSFIRKFKPRVCLEVGSWYGGSTCLIMTALLRNKNAFTFISSELENDLREATYRNVFTNCGITPIMTGDITKSLDFLPNKIDFLFVDTNHDRETTEWIVENLWPRLIPGALFAMHDWAVKEVDGKLVGKGHEGIGGTPETIFLMELYQQDKFPFEKIYWAWEYGPEEIAFWRKKKTKTKPKIEKWVDIGGHLSTTAPAFTGWKNTMNSHIICNPQNRGKERGGHISQ